MLLDADGHHHVAVLAAVQAGSALAAQADLLAVPHTGRDADLHGAPVRGELHGGTGDGVAQVQRRRGQDVGALLRLGLGAEATEAAESEGAGTATGAGGAGGAAEHAQQVVKVGLAGAAAGLEADAASLAAEHGGEDVLEAGAAGPSRATGLEAGAASGHRADRVVLLALGLVGQDRVGLSDLLELLGRRGVVGVAVGVVLLCECAIGLLDRGGVGVLTHAEDRIEVLRHPVLTGHGRLTASLSG